MDPVSVLRRPDIAADLTTSTTRRAKVAAKAATYQAELHYHARLSLEGGVRKFTARDIFHLHTQTVGAKKTCHNSSLAQASCCGL